MDFRLFCENTVELLEASRDSMRIQLDYEDSLENNLLLDGDLLRYILYNLLSNALKYSSEDSKVVLSVCNLNEGLEISVVDNGIGIPEAGHGNLFESFQRGSNVLGVSGTGLGLNIAKRAVEATVAQSVTKAQMALDQPLWFACQFHNKPPNHLFLVCLKSWSLKMIHLTGFL